MRERNPVVDHRDTDLEHSRSGRHMKLTVASPTRLDIYRDGGSLSVSFLDQDGFEWTLLFPVCVQVVDPQSFEMCGYSAPCLERFIDTSRISHVTGLESIDVTKESAEVSWGLARRILLELSPMTSQFEADYAYVFPMMVEAAATNGRPPTWWW
jgi:hypothetical protein